MREVQDDPASKNKEAATAAAREKGIVVVKVRKNPVPPFRTRKNQKEKTTKKKASKVNRAKR